jgi:hypothetical protein
MTAALHPISAFTAQPSDFTRAQILIQGHIAQVDAALRTLRANRETMLPSMADMHADKLGRLHRTLIHDLDCVLAAPLGCQPYIGRWNHNGRGPNVLDACEAVDRSIGKRHAYRDMLAARRGGLVVVS